MDGSTLKTTRTKFQPPSSSGRLPKSSDRGDTARWFLPLSILWEEDEPSAALPHRLAVARVRRGRRVGLLTDAFALPSFAYSFVAALAAGKEFAYSDGVVRFRPTESGHAQLQTGGDADVHWLAAEHSNSSLTVGDMAMLKIYRRISPGETKLSAARRRFSAMLFAWRRMERPSPSPSRSVSSVMRAKRGLGFWTT